MAEQNPATNTKLSLGLHTRMHNVFTVDTASPDDVVFVESDGTVRIGDKTTNYMKAGPTGNLLFVGSAGMAYGGMHYHGAGFNIVLAAQNTFYQILGFDTNGVSNNTTPDNGNDHIILLNKGIYLVTCSISARSVGSNDYIFAIRVNNGDTLYEHLQIHRTTNVASSVGAATISGFGSFSANDTVEVWVQRTDGAAVSKTITLEHITLSVLQVGG